eukprot:2195678-Prymnesium_polylepis.2
MMHTCTYQLARGYVPACPDGAPRLPGSCVPVVSHAYIHCEDGFPRAVDGCSRSRVAERTEG